MLTIIFEFRDEMVVCAKAKLVLVFGENLHIDLVAPQRVLQSHASLALSQHLCLPRNVSQMTNDLLIALLESI